MKEIEPGNSNVATSELVDVPIVATPASPQTYNNFRLVVPKRIVQGGFDEKFEDDPYNMDLKGIISFVDYKSAIGKINERIKPARSKKIDGVLLATSILMVPLPVWGARRFRQAKSRKKLLLEAIREFNADYPTLYMRWNKRPASILTIEHRIEEFHGPPPPREGPVSSVTGLQGSRDAPFEYD